MRCWAVVGVLQLAVAASCEAPVERPAAPPVFVVAPQATAWPPGISHSSIGRAQAPQMSPRAGISGAGIMGTLRLPTPWQVPGPGPARAVIYGSLGDGRAAIDLVDIDAGRILWRDTTACAAVVVGVTSDAVVCADGKGVRAVGLDGKSRWKHDDAGFVAMTDERVVVSDGRDVEIVDASSGDDLSLIKLPSGVTSDSILATCGDAGRELFASGQDNQLVRIAEAHGGPKVVWSVAADRVLDIDACTGTTVVVTVATPRGTELLAVARDTGKTLGTVTGVTGHWLARDGSQRIEIATATGIKRWARDLSGAPEPLESVPVDALLATRGELRLVRASARTAVLLDGKGVRAYMALAHPGAALGDHALLASTWTGSHGETVHRVPYPPRYARKLRLERGAVSIAVPAELRDLPARSDVDGRAQSIDNVRGDVKGIALTDTALHVLVDAPPAVATLKRQGGTWHQTRRDCGTGEAFALAADHDAVVCAVRDKDGVTLHGGTWTWRTDNADRLAIAGRVLLVWDADRLTALAAKTGAVIAKYSSSDGAAMPAAALDVNGMALIVTAEAGRVIARLPDVQATPAWSVAVDGVVVDIAGLGDAVLVTLEDGDAYRIDARIGGAVPIAGISASWHVAGDLVTSAGTGGPIPPAGWPPAAPVESKGQPKKRPRPKAKVKADTAPADDALPPRLMTPIAPPPGLAPSWQLALFDATGVAVARNDYALPLPVTPAARNPKAPLVVVSGDEALVLDPVRGDPVRRVRLPDDALPGTVFSTVVDGAPVVGVLLANPLRVLLF